MSQGKKKCRGWRSVAAVVSAVALGIGGVAVPQVAGAWEDSSHVVDWGQPDGPTPTTDVSVSMQDPDGNPVEYVKPGMEFNYIVRFSAKAPNPIEDPDRNNTVAGESNIHADDGNTFLLIGFTPRQGTEVSYEGTSIESNERLADSAGNGGSLFFVGTEDVPADRSQRGLWNLEKTATTDSEIASRVFRFGSTERDRFFNDPSLEITLKIPARMIAEPDEDYRARAEAEGVSYIWPFSYSGEVDKQVEYLSADRCRTRNTHIH